VLLGDDLLKVDFLAFFKRGQKLVLAVGACGFLVAVIVLALNVDRGKAREDHHLATGPKQRLARGYLHLGAVIDRRGHLAGHKAVPDQTVEGQLVLGQIFAQALGGAHGAGGPDGLVGLLGRGPGFVEVWFGRQIILAKLFHDQTAHFVNGFLGQAV
jgi:hypothetical protein